RLWRLDGAQGAQSAGPARRLLGNGHASRLGVGVLAADAPLPQARGRAGTESHVKSRSAIMIDVCVRTYRRLELADTLRSLAAMSVPAEAAIRVIVADNDDWPSAEELVEELAEALPFEVVYLHAPASNISVARNACLERADGDFVAFVDDD